MILTSESHSKHPFAGQNTQHIINFCSLVNCVLLLLNLGISIVPLFMSEIRINIIRPIESSILPILRPLAVAPGANAPGAPLRYGPVSRYCFLHRSSVSYKLTTNVYSYFLENSQYPVYNTYDTRQFGMPCFQRIYNSGKTYK